MKRVLIYIAKDQLKPVGGHRGYLYNLMCGWEENSDVELCFRTNLALRQKYHTYYEKLPNWIKEIHKSKQNLRDCKYMISDEPKFSKEKLCEFDAVHFHSTFDLYNCKDSLADYNGYVILTSHSPKPMHLEKIEDGISDRDRRRYSRYYEKLEMVDEYAFMRADYVIFPCEEAEEPYYNQWEKFFQIKKERKEHFYYMPSGIEKPVVHISREEIRKRFNVPEDAFLISYVGRHNEVKGYDMLQKIAIDYLEQKENAFVVCAGKEGPIYAPIHSRWIEVGWTNDPHSIINASDVFMLPNKETYFDLVLLEVLSIGTPIIASETGGNKYFSQFNSCGVRLFKNQEECIQHLNDISAWSEESVKEARKENMRLFENNFNASLFAKRYYDLLMEIL